MRDRVVPAAQIVTPNHFELDFLTGRVTTTVDEVLAAADALRAVGPDVVLVTSTVLDGDHPEEIRMLAVTDAGAWQVTTPRLERNFTGSGDLTAALFLAHYLEGDDAGKAMGRTADSVYSLLKATTAAGSAELLLVGAQDQLVHPTHHFDVERLR
jgi:pyridoxine kinase